MFQLNVDDRERFKEPVFDLMHGRERVQVEYKRLETGDFAVWYCGVLIFLIERKTWDDFARSMKRRDGEIECHIDTQARAMYDLAQKGVRIYLLVEGSRKSMHDGILSKNIVAKADSLMFKYRMPVIYTYDERGTAARIFELIDNCPDELIAERGVKGGDVKIKRAELTGMEIALRAVAKIPDVSLKTAQALLTRYTPRQIATEMKVEDVAAIQLSSSRIGRARAEKIVANACGALSSMIASVNGVSEDIAAKIAELPQIDKNSIADMPRNEKRRVGYAIATRIIDMLDFTSKM